MKMVTKLILTIIIVQQKWKVMYTMEQKPFDIKFWSNS